MSDPRDLTETRISSAQVFDGVLLHVRQDVARLPNGKQAIREYVVHPGAVAIVAITAAGKLVMERQYRYPLEREFIEIPAGKIDPGEDELAAAKRELAEETGYAARDWMHVTTIHPLIAYSTERIELYLASGLTQSTRALDEEEFLEVLEFELAEALTMVESGRITDSKTVIALLWLERLRARGLVPALA